VGVSAATYKLKFPALPIIWFVVPAVVPKLLMKIQTPYAYLALDGESNAVKGGTAEFKFNSFVFNVLEELKK
jgi:hypothetical protein